MSTHQKQVSILRPCLRIIGTTELPGTEIKQKILIADSDVTETARLKQFLQNHHYECILVNEVLTAVRQTVLQKPALLLINLGISGNNGLLIIHKLKYIPSAVNAVIIITGEGDSLIDMPQAMKMGAGVFLKKPLRNDEVLMAIQNGISGRQTKQISHLNRESSAA